MLDPRRTRTRLHQAVRDARRPLGSAIASERDRYWLDRDAVDIDLDELERHVAQGESQTKVRAIESWSGESGQRGNWSFCLPAAKMAAEQERT